MGYPNQPHKIFRPRCFAAFVLLLLLSLPALDGFTQQPRSLVHLPAGSWEHVTITDQSLKPHFGPLAAHRAGQGLRSRVVTTAIIRKWAGREDTVEAIRWFVTAAVREWGTRYVLLGGDASVIPVPLGYFENLHFSWEIPLDLYYAAPGGQWDLDGDGYLGEIEDDHPDLIPAVALGRAPVADPDEASAFVQKVLAFENQVPGTNFDALLVAEVGSPHPWSPGMEVSFDFAWEMEIVAGILAGMESCGDILTLYQNPDAPSSGIPLNPETFLTVLRDGDHRFAGMLVHGIPDIWSLGPAYLRPEHVADLAGMDHAVFLAGGIPGAADFRDASVMKPLMTLPDGGCVGGLLPSSMYYLATGGPFFREFWEILADGSSDRVGDAYRRVMESRVPIYSPTSAPALASLQCMSLVGDPALLFFPAEERNRPAPATRHQLTAVVSPNPFNPITEISFVIPEGLGGELPAEIRIFDLGGRRVARILNSALGPGKHTVPWFGEDDHGRKVGSGVYFAHIRAGELRTVEKLILLE